MLRLFALMLLVTFLGCEKKAPEPAPQAPPAPAAEVVPEAPAGDADTPTVDATPEPTTAPVDAVPAAPEPTPPAQEDVPVTA